MSEKAYCTVMENFQAVKVGLALLILLGLCCTAAPSARAATPWYAEGSSHTLALKPDGTVWSVGSDSYGQLGHGGSSWWHSFEPQRIGGLTGVVAVAAAGAHSLALKKDGTVWAWGHNGAGQLGNGTRDDCSVPAQVQGISDVTAIATGKSHVVALKRDGTVWAWGNNRIGQLGKEGTSQSSVPVRIGSIRNVASIAAGNYFTIALKEDGTVWSWGYNSNGALGNGSTSQSGSYRPVQVSGLSAVRAIAAGDLHCVAVRQDGTAWVWGSNDYSQLGKGKELPASGIPIQVEGISGVRDVTAKANHSIALKEDGSVWAWGDKDAGRWGNGMALNGSQTPVPMRGVSGATTVAAVVNPDTVAGRDTSFKAGAFGKAVAQAGIGLASITVAAAFLGEAAR